MGSKKGNRFKSSPEKGTFKYKNGVGTYVRTYGISNNGTRWNSVTFERPFASKGKKYTGVTRIFKTDNVKKG
jgi:hypothetical protein